MRKRFETILLEEAFEFIQNQTIKSRAKILQNIRRAEQMIDPKLFKKLDNEIWEFRTKYMNNQYRLFAFWDKDNKNKTLVIATHGVIKKTSKVEKKDLEKANQIRLTYIKNKENEKL